MSMRSDYVSWLKRDCVDKVISTDLMAQQIAEASIAQNLSHTLTSEYNTVNLEQTINDIEQKLKLANINNEYVTKKITQIRSTIYTDTASAVVALDELYTCIKFLGYELLVECQCGKQTGELKYMARVEIKSSGHKGTIINKTPGGLYEIELDNGQTITIDRDRFDVIADTKWRS